MEIERPVKLYLSIFGCQHFIIHQQRCRFQARIQQYFDQINKIIAGKKVSKKVIFILRDVVDLRQNKWIPRREERAQQRLAALLGARDNKQKKGGSGNEMVVWRIVWFSKLLTYKFDRLIVTCIELLFD